MEGLESCCPRRPVGRGRIHDRQPARRCWRLQIISSPVPEGQFRVSDSASIRQESVQQFTPNQQVHDQARTLTVGKRRQSIYKMWRYVGNTDERSRGRKRGSQGFTPPGSVDRLPVDTPHPPVLPAPADGRWPGWCNPCAAHAMFR